MIIQAKNIILRFRAADGDIFEAIRNGQKRIETRAMTVRYQNIRVGDKIIFIYGNKKIFKTASKIEIFKSINLLLKKHKPSAINPAIHTNQEARKMWYGFPGYKEKIKKYGLAAIHLR